jgi:hypothetical protein
LSNTQKQGDSKVLIHLQEHKYISHSHFPGTTDSRKIIQSRDTKSHVRT